jgi:LuxR family maltose regulon positive regulatory protein
MSATGPSQSAIDPAIVRLLANEARAEMMLDSKLRAPSLHPSWRERERVSARLDEALLDATRLTVVSAPPGYGKTVAVLGWLATRRLPHAWLTLDPADADPARFVLYLVAALAGVRPGLGVATLPLVSTGSSASPSVVAVTLADELAATDDGFVLVLDEFDAVAGGAAGSIVQSLVEQVPPFVHLVILTRSDPGLPTARMRASGRLLEIGTAELCFTETEAAEYLVGARIRLEPVGLARLLERTEGWAAGLQLASLLMRGSSDPTESLDALKGTHRFVLEYIAGEVVDRLDAPMREFLARTSVPDRFSLKLAVELAGAEAPTLLRRAMELNLFVQSLDAEGRWFRYHRLFVDYLRTLLPRAQAQELHSRAARHLAAEGLASEAIDHALAAGDTELSTELISAHAREAFDSGQLATLLGWLRRLPQDRVDADPGLAGLGAWALFLTGELAEARAWAARALTGDSQRCPNARLLVAAAIVAVVVDGSTQTAEELATTALAELTDDDFFRSQALLAIGEVRLSEGRLADAVATMEDALRVAVRSRQPMAIFPIAYLLTTGMNALGRRNEAEALCRHLLAEYSDARGRPLPIAGFARIALGALRYEANDLAEARQEIEAGFRDAATLGYARFMLGQAAGVLAVVRAATGAADLANQAASESGRHARALGMAPSVPQAAAIEAQLALARGDVKTAGRWADAELLDRVPAAQMIPRVRFQHDVVLARALLALGRFSDALGVLEELRVIFEAKGAASYVPTIATLMAVAYRVAGRQEEAVAAVEEAIDLAARGGYVRRIVEDGRPVVDLIEADRDRAPLFVARVLEGLRASVSPAPGGTTVGPPGGLVEPLTSREMDVLRLMARGLSNAAIADDLVVSLATAKWHVSHILAKLGAANRTDALLRAQQLGLV